MRSFLERLFRGPQPTGPEVPTPLLEWIDGREAGEWLRRSIVTFGVNVGSFLPRQFEAFARIEHGKQTEWSEEGNFPYSLIEPLTTHLAAATTTPMKCYFAVWEGYGVGTMVFGFPPGTPAKERRAQIESQPRPPAWKSRAPTLELPERRYHVFTGPIEGAATSLSGMPMGWQSANLWWPADHAWCVATEIDLAWTYVGGSRRLINGILRNPRLAAVETSASSER